MIAPELANSKAQILSIIQRGFQLADNDGFLYLGVRFVGVAFVHTFFSSAQKRKRENNYVLLSDLSDNACTGKGLN